MPVRTRAATAIERALRRGAIAQLGGRAVDVSDREAVRTDPQRYAQVLCDHLGDARIGKLDVQGPMTVAARQRAAQCRYDLALALHPAGPIAVANALRAQSDEQIRRVWDAEFLLHLAALPHALIADFQDGDLATCARVRANAAHWLPVVDVVLDACPQIVPAGMIGLHPRPWAYHAVNRWMDGDAAKRAQVGHQAALWCRWGERAVSSLSNRPLIATLCAEMGIWAARGIDHPEILPIGITACADAVLPEVMAVIGAGGANDRTQAIIQLALNTNAEVTT
jgi:hypothetical protein